MADTTHEHELEAALIDLLEGIWADHYLADRTGLSVDRCKEILDLRDKAKILYYQRNGA